MPTYTYQCTTCHYEYEKLQSITAKPDTICPQCGNKVERLIGGGAGIVFKGSGFYTTDYKNKPKNQSKKQEHSQKQQVKSQSS